MLSTIISIPFFVGLKRLLQGTDIFLFLTHRLVELVIQVERLVQPGNTGFCKKRALGSGTTFHIFFSHQKRYHVHYYWRRLNPLGKTIRLLTFDNFILSLLRTLGPFIRGKIRRVLQKTRLK